jgi:superoxide dismutase, Cu-Zn family
MAGSSVRARPDGDETQEATLSGRRTSRMRFGAAACAVAVWGVGAGAAPSSARERGATRAWVELIDADGDPVGVARFVETGSGAVHVNVRVHDLPPGVHGIHVHAVGSCAGAGFSGAGGHHNPSGAPHGEHAGDLPNLVVNRAGRGRLNTSEAPFTLTDGPTTVFDADGSALVIHAQPDDGVTDPAGNSGARIACGVIQT